MNQINFCLVLMLTCFIAGGAAKSTGNERAGPLVWDYAGVADWPTDFPSYCGGSSQSPINLNRFQSTHGLFYPQLTFNHYDDLPTQAKIMNNGHTVSVYLDLPHPATIEGAWLSGEYTFAQYHFHWGSDSTKGSEHTVDGTRYPMELHLVHYKTSYGDLATAAAEDDGLAVLGILFDQSNNDNAALAPLISSLTSISAAGTNTTATNFSTLASLLPKELKSFYRYKGGLTTPTCNQVVTWTVFTDRLAVSKDQLVALRSLMDVDGNSIQDNFRPTQPINNRTVEKSFF